MFSTWKFQTTDKGEELARQPQVFDPMTAKTKGPQACTHCRAKKVKCTGEETGCERCRTLLRKCVYAKGGSGSRHRSSSSREERQRRTSVQESQTFSTPDLTAVEPVSSLFNDDFSWIESSGVIEGLIHPVQDALNDSEVVESQDMALDLTEWDTRTVMQSMRLGIARSRAQREEQMRSMGMEHTPGDGSPTGVIGDVLEWACQSFDGSPGLSLPTPPSTEPPEPCYCLRRVVLLLDKAKSLITVDAHAVDSALATNKEALSHGRDMLACTTCVGRVEYMTILTFMLDEIARLSQSITHILQSSDQKAYAGRIDSLSFGNYEVDSQNEYSIIARGLLRLQLDEMETFTKSLKHVLEQVHSNSMAKRLAGTEGAIAAMLESCKLSRR